MVLAVPLTAVVRIHLAHIEHPLPQCLAMKLGGSPLVVYNLSGRNKRSVDVEEGSRFPARSADADADAVLL